MTRFIPRWRKLTCAHAPQRVEVDGCLKTCSGLLGSRRARGNLGAPRAVRSRDQFTSGPRGLSNGVNFIAARVVGFGIARWAMLRPSGPALALSPTSGPLRARLVCRDRPSVDHRRAFGVNGMHLRPWTRLRSAIAGLRYGERGQTSTEYALLIAMAAVILIVAIMFLGGKVSDRFRGTGSETGILEPPTVQCDPNYADACVPPFPPDLDCADLRALGLPLPVRVVSGDPHGLDPDGDGLGC